METLLNSLITGVISGAVASLVFTLVMYNLRPKITISPQINSAVYRDGVKLYGIKILNERKFSSILDVRAELVLMTPINTHKGTNHHLDTIQLKTNHIAQCNRKSKKDKNATYAVIFTTPENIDKLWVNDSQFLTFKIYGKHPFSGFSKAFEQTYYTKKDSVKEGQFTFGFNFDIS